MITRRIPTKYPSLVGGKVVLRTRRDPWVPINKQDTITGTVVSIAPMMKRKANI
jgi:hypothetical protein